jgi:alanine dehydrogenase
MVVGVPTEIKDNENRVAVTPGGVRQLTLAGHEVRVQSGAGIGSGLSNEEFEAAGARIVPSAADAYAADMVVKVKEPMPSEYPLLRADMVLFTYLHLAADETLTRAMLAAGVTGVAYETVELPDRSLPLLTPMSEVAGRMAVQVGAHYLERGGGGSGTLLGGVPGVPPGRVAIVGGGTVGTEAAKMALGLGAEVHLLDINLDRLRYLEEVLTGRFFTLSSNALTIAQAVRDADLVVGAVLIPGAKAPRLVTRSMIESMRDGSVVVDVAVDQGGCFETTRATTHSAPTYVVDGVVHYCVSNMPGAVPRTSTFALGNATLPYVAQLAGGFETAVRRSPALAHGVNTYRGQVVYPGVAEAFGLPQTPLEALL